MTANRVGEQTAGSLALALLASCAAAPTTTTPPAPVELVVLGIAQDGGLPHFGCEQPCCVQARQSGRVLFPACLGVVDRRGDDGPRLLLIEATPRIEEQVALLHELASVQGRGRQPVDAVLTTHAHLGHYLGLAWFGREVAGSKQVPLHASPRFCAFVREHAPWRQLVALGQLAPMPFVVGEPFAPWPGLQVTALAVPHRDEWSDTMAFVVRGPQRAVLFVPDVDAWDKAPGLLRRLLDGVDIAYLDGTFYDGRELPDRDLAEIPHPLMTRTMELLAEVAAQRPGALRFLHCNHSNPVLHDAALRERLTARGFALAVQGERVAL
ncbi:MAG: MBL fold metallo-hydrolase [Planctomycetes bacterium]|jgi:pyrroloquinoline quinone biosynthesis protein B|nr:MBL fold metallo-hydrolase [Planctomycetota bacterium]